MLREHQGSATGSHILNRHDDRDSDVKVQVSFKVTFELNFESVTLFGKSGLQGLPTRVALPLRDIQLRLSKGATGVHNMGLCGRPGEDPNAWKQFGPETTGQ